MTDKQKNNLERFAETEQDRIDNHVPLTKTTFIGDFIVGFVCAAVFAMVIYTGLLIVMFSFD